MNLILRQPEFGSKGTRSESRERERLTSGVFVAGHKRTSGIRIIFKCSTWKVKHVAAIIPRRHRDSKSLAYPAVEDRVHALILRY